MSGFAMALCRSAIDSCVWPNVAECGQMWLILAKCGPICVKQVFLHPAKLDHIEAGFFSLHSKIKYSIHSYCGVHLFYLPLEVARGAYFP